jgi:hypothetical protein
MELDRKALAVTRLVAAIYQWDPRGNVPFQDTYRREKAAETLINQALPEQSSKDNLLQMIKAMTLLTSGNVESVRNPEGFNPNKAKPWSTILSDPSKLIFQVLRGASYERVTQQDYANAKVLIPVIASSSLLEAEVFTVFSSTGLSRTNSALTQSLYRGDTNTNSIRRALGGYEHLYRGLSDMSDQSIIRCTDIARPWNLERGVSTSRNYASAKGFSQKDGPNHIVFVMDNPSSKGFSALNLSKYKAEEEIILSGIVQIYHYQLKFWARDPNDHPHDGPAFAIEVTPNMIFIRKGYTVIYGKENLGEGEAHEFVKRILTATEPVELTTIQGAKERILPMERHSSIEVYGRILE